MPALFDKVIEGSMTAAKSAGWGVKARPAVSHAPLINSVANIGVSSMLGHAGGGAIVGFGTGYYYRGGGVSGGVKGAIAGGIMGGAGGAGGAAALGRMAQHSGSYSAHVARAAQVMSTTEGRSAFIAGGGFLGGMVFGGGHKHKRGFNKNRGNSIGH